MKVNPAATKGLSDLARSKAKGLEADEAKQSSAKASVSAAGSAKVNLSKDAQALQKAKDIASDQSIDEAKVSRIQKLIDAGQYRVDAEAIADKLVDEHLLMDS